MNDGSLQCTDLTVHYSHILADVAEPDEWNECVDKDNEEEYGFDMDDEDDNWIRNRRWALSNMLDNSFLSPVWMFGLLILNMTI